MNPDAALDQPAEAGTPFDKKNGGRPRQLRPGQRSQLWVADAETGSTELLLESSELLFEAPNWTLDGTQLIVNGDGSLWSIPLADPALRRIDLEGVPDLNNDHVLDPDGRHIYVSAMDWHIYKAPLEGGAARRVTGGSGIDGLLHFLHGVSPDGERLAFIGLELPDNTGRTRIRANVFTMSTTGDDYVAITSTEHASPTRNRRESAVSRHRGGIRQPLRRRNAARMASAATRISIELQASTARRLAMKCRGSGPPCTWLSARQEGGGFLRTHP